MNLFKIALINGCSCKFDNRNLLGNKTKDKFSCKILVKFILNIYTIPVMFRWLYKVLLGLLVCRQMVLKWGPHVKFKSF